MQTIQHILDFSTLGVILAVLVATYKVGLSAYGNTLSSREFNYRFDKTKLPICGRAIVVLVIFSYSYCLLVAKQADVAAVYSLIMTFFGSIGILLRIAYVPKRPKPNK